MAYYQKLKEGDHNVSYLVLTKHVYDFSFTVYTYHLLYDLLGPTVVTHT